MSKLWLRLRWYLWVLRSSLPDGNFSARLGHWLETEPAQGKPDWIRLRIDTTPDLLAWRPAPIVYLMISMGLAWLASHVWAVSASWAAVAGWLSMFSAIIAFRAADRAMQEMRDEEMRLPDE